MEIESTKIISINTNNATFQSTYQTISSYPELLELMNPTTFTIDVDISGLDVEMLLDYLRGYQINYDLIENILNKLGNTKINVGGKIFCLSKTKLTDNFSYFESFFRHHEKLDSNYTSILIDRSSRLFQDVLFFIKRYSSDKSDHSNNSNNFNRQLYLDLQYYGFKHPIGMQIILAHKFNYYCVDEIPGPIILQRKQRSFKFVDTVYELYRCSGIDHVMIYYNKSIDNRLLEEIMISGIGKLSTFPLRPLEVKWNPVFDSVLDINVKKNNAKCDVTIPIELKNSVKVIFLKELSNQIIETGENIIVSEEKKSQYTFPLSDIIDTCGYVIFTNIKFSSKSPIVSIEITSGKNTIALFYDKNPRTI